MNKKSRQKLKYFENEKSFRGDIKSIFSSFLKGLVAKNCLRNNKVSVENSCEDYHAFFNWMDIPNVAVLIIIILSKCYSIFLILNLCSLIRIFVLLFLLLISF